MPVPRAGPPRSIGPPAALRVAVRLQYPVRMKRTNLVLDERLLDEALRLSGERTYSKAVGRALAEFVRRVKARRIRQLAGSGLWEGDLSEMRGDRPRR